ncbi:MAG: hypothetical protein R3B13_00855 [Polyangiaceae bacterium]
MHSAVPLEQLARAHGFSLEALAANRAGQIHQSQTSRGKAKGVGCAIFFFVLSFLFAIGGVGGAVFFYSELHEPISRVDMNGVYAIAGGGLLLGLFAFLAAVASVVSILRRRKLYERNALEVFEGPISKTVIRQSGVADEYAYDVGGRRFRFLPQQGWDLVQHGMRYRVYAVRDDLLAIEPL